MKTIDNLRAEAKRLRVLASRIDDIVFDMEHILGSNVVCERDEPPSSNIEGALAALKDAKP